MSRQCGRSAFMYFTFWELVKKAQYKWTFWLINWFIDILYVCLDQSCVLSQQTWWFVVIFCLTRQPQLALECSRCWPWTVEPHLTAMIVNCGPVQEVRLMHLMLTMAASLLTITGEDLIVQTQQPPVLQYSFHQINSTAVHRRAVVAVCLLWQQVFSYAMN